MLAAEASDPILDLRLVLLLLFAPCSLLLLLGTGSTCVRPVRWYIPLTTCTCHLSLATCCLLHTAGYFPRILTTHFLLLATYYLLHTACYVLLAVCSMRCAPCYSILRATCYMYLPFTAAVWRAECLLWLRSRRSKPRLCSQRHVRIPCDSSA